jgi:hypothetical protein
MGADGGIKITKIQEIKEKWETIRETLIIYLENDLKYAQSWEIKYAQSNLEESKNLPITINHYTGHDIVKMFGFISSCDCPYWYEDNIITAEGDNVPFSMNTLSNVLPGISIETWT